MLKLHRKFGEPVEYGVLNLPQEMVSDRGTNSIAADRELREIVEKLNESKSHE